MSRSETNLFSADIKFKDIIKHFRKMDREQIADDIEKSLDDIENLEVDGESFGAFLVRSAYDAKMKKRASTAEFGKLGGRPRKKPEAASTSTDVAPVGATKRNNQLVWGKFENVYLSQEEYNELALNYGNINLLNKVIDAFSSSLADGNAKSGNHYATLTRWIEARKRWDEEGSEKKETFQEREGRRQVEQLKKFGLIK